MTNEEFLRDVCPNHTEKSQWNKSELLHILELQKEQLRLHIVSQQRELLAAFQRDYNKRNFEGSLIADQDIELFLAANCG